MHLARKRSRSYRLALAAAVALLPGVAPAAEEDVDVTPADHRRLVEGNRLLEDAIRSGDTGGIERARGLATELERRGFPLLGERVEVAAAWSVSQRAAAVETWDRLAAAERLPPLSDPAALTEILDACRALGDRWCEGRALVARADCLAQGGPVRAVAADAAAAETILRRAGPSVPLGWALHHQRTLTPPGTSESVDRSEEVLALAAATGDAMLEGYALAQRVRDTWSRVRQDDVPALLQRIEKIAATGAPARVAAYAAYLRGLTFFYQWKGEDARRTWNDFLQSDAAALAPRESVWIHVGTTAASNLMLDWQGTIALAERAADLAERLHGSQDRAALYTNLAVAYLVLGRYTEAEDNARHGLDLGRQAGHRGAEQASLRVLGGVSLARGQPQDALSLCGQSLQIARETAQSRDVVLSTVCVAGAMSRLERRAEATRLLEEAVAASAEADPFVRSMALNQLTWQRLLDGEPAAAAGLAQQVLDLLGPSGPGTQRGAALLHRGHARLALQDHAAALEDFRTALDIARQTGARDTEAASAIGLGNVYYQLARLERAEFYYRLARTLAEESGAREAAEVARGNLDLLESRWTIGPERREALLRRAASPPDGVGFEDVNSRLNLATFLRDAGEPGAAELLAREALVTATAQGYVAQTVRGRTLLAETLVAQGAPAAAVEQCRLALEEERRPDALLEIGVQWDCGNVLLAADERADGVAALRRAAHLAERARKDLRHTGLRATFLSDRTQIFVDLAQAVLDDPERPRDEAVREALAISERFRAWTLLGALAANAADEGAARPDTARGRRAILSRMAEIQLEGMLDGAEGSRLDELRDLEDRFAELPDAPPPLGAALSDPAQLPARDDTLFVEYLVGRNGSHALIVHAGQLEAVPLPVRRGELAADVDRYLRLLSRRSEDPARDLQAIATLGHRLHQGLLAPLGKRLEDPVSRLVVVPDGPLHALPFEALVTRTEGPRFLVEEVEVSVAPSLSVLSQIRAPDGPGPPSLWALANPAPGERGWPFIARRMAVEVPAALPYAEEEVREAARRLGGENRILVGPEATEAGARDGLAGGARIVHFASHGFLDADSIGRSGLLLAPDPALGDDGLLQAREVVDLDVRADLVVLSGCATSGVRLVPGEGLMGLPHALLQAGAPAVVMSLWQVRDRAAARFMARFYRALARGDSAAGALRAAKLGLIHSRNPRLRHPSVWAPFVLTGLGDRPLVTGTWIPGGSLQALAAIGLLILGAVLWMLSVRAKRSRNAPSPTRR